MPELVCLCTECGLTHEAGKCDGRPNLSGYPLEFQISLAARESESEETSLEEPGYGHGV